MQRAGHPSRWLRPLHHVRTGGEGATPHGGAGAVPHSREHDRFGQHPHLDRVPPQQVHQLPDQDRIPLMGDQVATRSLLGFRQHGPL